MPNRAYVSFSEVKEKVPIPDALQQLGILEKGKKEREKGTYQGTGVFSAARTTYAANNVGREQANRYSGERYRARCSMGRRNGVAALLVAGLRRNGCGAAGRGANLGGSDYIRRAFGNVNLGRR